ncbi:MAG: hypothetical protein FD165_2579 [Gammaproteobacteria bacterium]|nr:MAG: hypothetical protein FD165_2579 [Gammaproteobacteria bacterium]TND04054.1 MAG: hypothetical protein FD120_1763 [Gammaproteobacteria bacterium]
MDGRGRVAPGAATARNAGAVAEDEGAFVGWVGHPPGINFA